MAANPTWDGRGVTIGILDLGVTLDHPSLLTTSTGERKIVDWVTYTDPFTDNDPTWVNMAAQVSGSSFIFNDVAYTAPAAGSYRIGLFNERDPRLGGEVGNDVNRDGNPAGSKGIFAVLWNTTSNAVYVDTNQNNSFADDLAMTDYRVNYDIGTFGTDNPATAVREAMPFVVQTDGQKKVINIGIVSGAHGSHVAGITAGNQLFGGAMSGAAPGRATVSVRVCLFIAGCTAHALVEGMIFVAKQGNVDVINMSIGGLPALNDGNNTRAVLYDRLIEQYNVQMFISAGNSGAGVNTIGDPSVAGKVMSVGSYITKATWQSNYGSDSTDVDNMHPFSSRGPARGWWLQAEHHRPRRGRFDDAALAGGRASRRHLQPAAGLLDVQWHVDGLASGGRRSCVAAQRGHADRRPEAAGPDPAGAELVGALHRWVPGTRTGKWTDRRRRRLGPAPDEYQDGGDHLVGAGQHGAERLPGNAGDRPGHLRPRRRHCG